jgi:hypothetical protein
MNNEKYNQIIDEVYENYLKGGDIKWLKKTEVDTPLGEMTIHIPYTKDEFIDKCKTDQEFSERRGLKMEERELSLNDRILEFAKRNLDPYEFRRGGKFGIVIPQWKTLQVLNKHNIPTRAISLTYQNESIQFYL